MIAAMNQLGWERVLLVYSTNDYGEDAINEFIRQSQTTAVCVVETVGLPPTGSVNEIGPIIANIDRFDVHGAVYFGSHDSMTRLMAALQMHNSTAEIQWMLSLVNMNDDVLSKRMRGTLFAQPSFTRVTEFFEYFTNNIDDRNPPPENPWYQDWYMETFQ